MGLDLFKRATSLPGISLNWAFDTIPKEQKFYLFSPRHDDMGEVMRSNLTGGPSTIFQRCQVKGIKPIHGNDNFIVDSIISYDVNTLYLWSTAQPIPMGITRV